MNIRSLMDDYLVALRFFSRIKVSDRLLSRAGAGEHSMDFSKAGGVAPLVGLSIALPSCIALILLSTAGVNIYVNAALALALLAILTGALHDDGLADCADGFFVQGGRDKKLAIMADSRLGTFGALALFFVNATHIFLLGALLEQLEAPLVAFCLAFAQALSRYLLLCCWYFQPLARNEGLAAKAYPPEAQSLLMGGVIIAVIWLLAGLWIPPGASLAAILLAILAATGVAMLAGAKISGVTGDVLGAIQQLSALALMLGFHLFA